MLGGFIYDYETSFVMLLLVPSPDHGSKGGLDWKCPERLLLEYLLILYQMGTT